MLRRSAVVGILFAAIMSLSSVRALASPPAANGGPNRANYCAAEGGFTLVPTFALAQAESVDTGGNGNGLVCVKVLPTPDNAQAHVLVMDDLDR